MRLLSVKFTLLKKRRQIKPADVSGIVSCSGAGLDFYLMRIGGKKNNLSLSLLSVVFSYFIIQSTSEPRDETSGHCASPPPPPHTHTPPATPLLSKTTWS